MQIKAKLKGENQTLVQTLTERGIVAKLVNNGVIAELQEVGGSFKEYEIPEELDDATLCIDIAEEGGARTNTGSGTIVCGLAGERLRPYYVPRGGDRACRTHAHFSLPRAVVTVTGYRQDDTIRIQGYEIVREGRVARIESREIWSGELETLPNSFSRFRSAAEAANLKGHCYHCRHPHFALVKQEFRSSEEYCDGCGKPVESSWKLCPHCGYELRGVA
jgi:hypothetical protein